MAACESSMPSWPALKAEIRQTYPDVKHISVEDFRAMEKRGVFLVDVRAKEEYRVSHIRHAVNFEQPKAIKSAFRESGKFIIVLYCSVGYRSAHLADKLQSQVDAPVYNLEGSIFEWVNAGHPVYRGETRVTEVHPYDAEWGMLLKKEYHPN